MSDIDWKFDEKRNTMVITTKNIAKGKKKIVFVSHDLDDGMWQFLDGTICDEKNASIISLEEMIDMDKSILQLATLPLGFIAYRKDDIENWIIEKNPNNL